MGVLREVHMKTPGLYRVQNWSYGGMLGFWREVHARTPGLYQVKKGEVKGETGGELVGFVGVLRGRS